MSATARTEDESDVEIGHSQSTERATACFDCEIALWNPANLPPDIHAMWPRLGRLPRDRQGRTGQATGDNRVWTSRAPPNLFSQGAVYSNWSDVVHLPRLITCCLLSPAALHTVTSVKTTHFRALGVQRSYVQKRNGMEASRLFEKVGTHHVRYYAHEMCIFMTSTQTFVSWRKMELLLR